VGIEITQHRNQDFMPKDSPQNPPAEVKPPAVHLYSQADPIPVPDAVESETDSVWGLWEDLVSPEKRAADNGFEATQPADLLPNFLDSPNLVDFPNLDDLTKPKRQP
jgi:hypothetical protein